MLTEEFPPWEEGGAARVAGNLAEGLRSNGHEVMVITRVRNESPSPDPSIVVYCPGKTSSLTGFFREKRMLFAAVTKVLSSFRPDIIDYQQAKCAFHLRKFLPLKGIPSVFTFHSSLADELRHHARARFLSPFAPLAALMERMTYRNFDSVVALSQYSVDYLKEHFDVSAQIVAGGVDLGRFSPENGDPKRLLTARRMIPRTGLGNLIKAAGILRGRGHEFELRVAGTGPLESRFKLLAKSLGGTVRFLGKISDESLADEYGKSGLFILPSLALEHFGLVILEAFASGTPVIGTPVGAIPKLVNLQGPGYLSRTPKPEDIALAIEEFWKTPVLSPSKLRAIASPYTWKTRAKLMGSIYSRV